MHVDGALLQMLPDFFNRKPTASEIRRDEGDERVGLEPRAMQKITGQAADAAEDGHYQLRFPFVDVLIDMLGFLEKLDFAWDHFRPGQIPPAPEFRSGG